MASLESIFNHVVLPPKLPGQQDSDIDDVNHAVLARLIRACDTLAQLPGHSLRLCHRLNQGRLEKASLQQAFDSLGPDELLILHVVEQNAAVLIRRQERQVSF